MEKIWLQQYSPNTPPTIEEGQFSSLVALLEDCFHRYAEKIAFSNLGVTLTYAELDRLSGAFAAFLLGELKLTKGARVGVMLPNVLQSPVVIFGILRAGLIVVNINPLYTPAELAYQLDDSGAETIVVLANFAHNLELALPKTKIKQVIVTELGDLMGLKGQLIRFIVKYWKKLIPPYQFPHVITLKKALQRGERYIVPVVSVGPEDIAFLQYTGGTTGVAKGAMLSHRNILANILQCYHWVKGNLRQGEEVVVIALPLYHIFSLTICGLTFIYFGGHGLLITNPRDVPGMVKQMTKVPVSVFVGVNTLFNALLNNSKFIKLDWTHLRISVAGGMALQHSVAERWQQLTGNWILEGYGLTEASPVVTINPLNIQAFNGSIGLPISSTDVKICDDQGQELPLGEEGELWIKGPQVMKGY